MIIDIHTHAFPDAIADRATTKLAKMARIVRYLDGSKAALMEHMKQSGVDLSVLQPVATKQNQSLGISREVYEINEHTQETGLLSFGAIHPDDEDYKEIIRDLHAHGVVGVKLHPPYQEVYFDDIRYLRILDLLCELDMYALVHCGSDVGLPGNDFSSIPHILPVLEKIDASHLILAHMGGFGAWDDVEQYIAGSPAYLDTAYALRPIQALPGTDRTEDEDSPMPKEQFLRIVQRHGANRILFGTDSPWDAQRDAIETIQQSGLSPDAIENILGENAKKVLRIS